MGAVPRDDRLEEWETFYHFNRQVRWIRTIVDR